jgi:hypothetical protein
MPGEGKLSEFVAIRPTSKEWQKQLSRSKETDD